jgi:hypothetical protein
MNVDQLEYFPYVEVHHHADELEKNYLGVLVLFQTKQFLQHHYDQFLHERKVEWLQLIHF